MSMLARHPRETPFPRITETQANNSQNTLPGVITTRPINVAESRSQSIQERRRKRRATVVPMYSQVMVRVLNKRAEPIEGYALNVSETGIAVELDQRVPPGSPVAIEFMVSGLGRARPNEWPTFVATAEVTRNDNLDDFPRGPYRTALRFVRLPTIVQAQIARYVAQH